ncbi:amino acid ABC transporter permease [Castellaniella defragrans]|uniref:Polar amino acid ABC transporter, inner membrane subunit n=2 Tax=Castellaniella defragrans TaxID=75697 RepID=W8WZV5_CASD6|nr:amino acid ABC transporter permease [Castellaniella defragrans]KAB0610741.1 amino acid ABC transporter permease [Castellaniella defragrans]MBB6083173.1 polar amino acid transport system permease protein [Castellaniella defragrans]CDM25323.1 polar amino acid ABC transporter, inner membrane subunit [Castellaniella defragrans 65Phen]
MDYGFDFSFLDEFWPSLLDGLWVSIRMAAVSLCGGFVLGVLLAVARGHGSRLVRHLAGGFVDLTRNTPLIVQTFWLFFGLSALDVRVPAFYAAVVALAINTSGYTCEIVRAGIDSVHAGQKEAAACLGLSPPQILRYVVLPQAIEKMYPSLISQFVLMMLATSIMSEISVEELTAIGYQIQSQTFRGFEAYLVIAAIYLIMSWLLRVVMTFCYNVAFPKQRHMSAQSRAAARRQPGRGKPGGTAMNGAKP